VARQPVRKRAATGLAAGAGDYASKRESLTRALHKIAVQHQILIPGMARELILRTPVPDVSMVGVARALSLMLRADAAARAQLLNTSLLKAKSNRTRQGLHKIARETHRLLRAIDELPQAAEKLLDRKTLTKIVGALVGLENATKDAANTVVAEAGRPRQVRPGPAAEIVDITKQFYAVLSDKTPGRHNAAFVELLNEVYRVLGIAAKAGSRAR
jgi:hypothetical protein